MLTGICKSKLSPFRIIVFIVCVAAAGAAYAFAWPLIANICCYAGLRQIAFSNDPQAKKILFIGNSLTYTNNVPGMFVQLVTRTHPEKHLCVESFTWPDSTLSTLKDRSETKALLAQHWDYIILQEHSSNPFQGTPHLSTSFQSFLPLIVPTGAKPVVIMTWANRRQFRDQIIISRLYTQTCRQLNLFLAPVGDLFFYVQKVKPDVELYQQDGHHPGMAGSYLYALALYALLFDEDSVSVLASPEASTPFLSPAQSRILTDAFRTWRLPAKERPLNNLIDLRKK